jgi:creatinine amidohydrolase
MHRKQSKYFLILVIVSLGIMIKPAPTQQNKPNQGDSIFAGTMVDMTWQEVEKAAQEGAVILTSTAVIEQHGPHMSCGIDTYLGYLYCTHVRKELESRGVKTLVAPPFFWGINSASHVFPGSFTVRPETMKALLHDMFAALKSWGFTDIININAHGDGAHIRTVIDAVIESRKSLGVDVRYAMPDWQAKLSGLSGKEGFILTYKAPEFDMASMKYMDLHAGAYETGLVAAYFPHQLNEKVAKEQIATKVTMQELGDWVKDMRRVTPLGYLGDPANFDAEQARKDFEEECRGLADAVENILKK